MFNFLPELRINGKGTLNGHLILKEIQERLGFLNSVGLTLTLNRAAATLSGGEAQRIRLYRLFQFNEFYIF